LESALKKMSPEKRDKFAESVAAALANSPEANEVRAALAAGGNNLSGRMTPSVALGALQVGIRAGGFASYQALVIGLNSISRLLFNRGLTVAGNAAATRAFSLVLGPIGWIITAISLVPIMSGPAYRVTIPAVVQVSMLRLKALAPKRKVGRRKAKKPVARDVKKRRVKASRLVS
jgi:hypothetical protein